ncbi:integrator complex subunit 4-like isoform X2 [Dysidea avara]
MVTHCLSDGDSRVRRAALEAMSTIATNSSSVLELSVYKEVSSAIYDDSEQVRLQAARLLWQLGNLLGTKKVAVKDSSVEINVLDDAFVKICDKINDSSMKVRMLAAKLMGTFNGVTFKFLEQTLDKKLMSHLKHVKSDHERQREMYQSGGSMEWDSGKKWGQGIPQGGAVNKNEVILINQGACGAFVQSLEDEYMEVRKAAIESICQLSSGCSRFAALCLDFLVDMFNDEIEAVRLHSISCVGRVSSNITLREDQLEPVLNVLKDKSSDIREALHKLLCSSHLTSTSGLRTTVDALLGNLSKYPQDKVSIWKCFKMIGHNHGYLTASLVPELLSTHPFFMTSEPDVDDPAYVCVLVLIFSATEHCSTLPALFPSHVFRHYDYLSDSLPDIVPRLNAMRSADRRSCDPSSSSVTEKFLHKTLVRISAVASSTVSSCDAHQVMEMCISDLNQAALLDHTLGAPLHYVAMVCRCHVLLNEVKKTLSQDIVLTTISPQRSVMATAVHSLEEVISLSYQLQHGYSGQQDSMLCSVVQLRIVAHAMQLLLAMQLNLDVTDSVQFTEMKQSMIKRLLVTSRFFAASGRNYPTALKKLMDDDVISISHDALANLLQPIINDDLPLSLQLPQLLPLRQATAEITDPVEEESSGGDTTTFVASLALQLHVRAVLHNVSQLNRVAVRVTYPDQRQLFYQPKPSEVRNVSATTDSLQVSLVLSHSTWTEPCKVEVCIVERLTTDTEERVISECLSRVAVGRSSTGTLPAVIAAKDILYSETIPLSNPIKVTLLPKADT